MNLIQTSKAAPIAGMSPRTLRSHAANGLVPCLKIGDRLYFTRSDLLALKKITPLSNAGRKRGVK